MPGKKRPHGIVRASVAMVFWLLAVFFSPLLCAHDVDTSYARVRIFDDHIEVRLAFDIVALRRIAPELDANADGALNREELRLAAPAIQKFLRAHIATELDERASDMGVAKEPFWPLDAPDSIPASAWHTNEALISFGFDKPLASPAKSVSLVFDVFRTLGERHRILGVFEYRGQITEVIFSLAEPDYLFDAAYAASQLALSAGAKPATIASDKPSLDSSGRVRGNSGDSPAWRYFKMGIEHILTGYDHLCFLLALIVVGRLRPLVEVVTSFTIAHSITLLLAASEVVKIRQDWIECSIAATIIYVAVENLVRTKFTHRWMLTFFFGLIHGFGFANTLNPQELPVEAKTRCLLVFNLGVEAGQLAIILLIFPAMLLLGKWKHGPRVKTAISAAVALLGLAWFLDRAFGLGWMPI